MSSGSDRRENISLGVVGLGYVGIEVTTLGLQRGYDVVAHDISERVRSEVSTAGYETHVSGNLDIVGNGEDVGARADIIVIAVPTPLNSSYSVDLSALKSASKAVSTGIGSRDGCPAIIVESTIPPGTVRNEIKPIFESRGTVIGRNAYLAHAPERIDPANEQWPLESLPRVVGALTEQGLNKVSGFYSNLLDADVYPVDSVEVAEAAKIIENAFRDVNIAFVNEVALSLSSLDVDATKAIDAAATKPFGFMKFEPGAGVGGHCIPIDPYLLIDQASQNGFNHRLLKEAREINEKMPDHVVDQTIRALNHREILPKGATVLLLGKAFKPDVTDTRNSPYFDIREGLEGYECSIDVYDPMLPEDSTVESPYSTADAVVLVTDHPEFRNLNLSEFERKGTEVFVDARNVYREVPKSELEMEYIGIGQA
jgi:nucleotide sugar dehydrogenase